MSDDDDEIRLGHYRDPQTGREFFSGRVGRHHGRPARPFHAKLVNIGRHQGGAARGRAGLEYIERAERYESRADELEATGGYSSREELAAALEAVEASSTRKDALVVRTAVIELPADSTPEARRLTAQALADWFEERGHPTRWSIHSTPQPHLHLITTARAAWKEWGGTWEAEPQGKKGQPGRRILNGPIETHHWRAAVASIINITCKPAVEFHPGRLADVGLDRPAKVRLPAAEYWRRTCGQASTNRRTNERIDAGEHEHTAIQAERQAWRESRRAKQAARAADDRAHRLHRARQLVADHAEVIDRQRLAALRQAAASAPPPPLSEKQRAWIEDAHRGFGLDLPDLGTHEGRNEAFGVAKAWNVTQEKIRSAAKPLGLGQAIAAATAAAGRPQEARRTTPAPIFPHASLKSPPAAHQGRRDGAPTTRWCATTNVKCQRH